LVLIKEAKILLRIVGVVIIAIFTSGCLRTYYPVIYSTAASPIVFETNDQDTLSSKYIGADLLISNGSYEDESLYLIKGSYNRVYTADYTNFNVKFFGYTGIYQVAGLHKYNGNKSVFGLGTDLSFNVNFKINRFKMGVGISTGVGAEFGGYYNFQKTAIANGVIGGGNNLFIFTFSLFPVFAYQFSESTLLSFQINIGFPGLITPSITLNKNNNIYWLGYTPINEAHDFPINGGIVLGIMMNLNKF